MILWNHVEPIVTDLAISHDETGGCDYSCNECEICAGKGRVLKKFYLVTLLPKEIIREVLIFGALGHDVRNGIFIRLSCKLFSNLLTKEQLWKAHCKMYPNPIDLEHVLCMSEDTHYRYFTHGKGRAFPVKTKVKAGQHIQLSTCDAITKVESKTTKFVLTNGYRTLKYLPRVVGSRDEYLNLIYRISAYSEEDGEVTVWCRFYSPCYRSALIRDYPFGLTFEARVEACENEINQC